MTAFGRGVLFGFPSEKKILARVQMRIWQVYGLDEKIYCRALYQLMDLQPDIDLITLE